MGTDIHLEAERRWAHGGWERIPHMPELCWACGTYDPEKGIRVDQTGMQNVVCLRDEMLPDDMILRSRNEDSDNPYVILERMEPCRYCHGTKYSHPQFLNDRHYDVFSILADVRNGYGFAGVVTSSGFNPITSGRGIPDDLSEEIRAHLKRIGYDVVAGDLEYHRDGEEEDDDGEGLYEKLEKEPEGYWSLGEHSFTWVTLQEIFDFDWTQTITKTGWVSPVDYLEYRDHGSPSSYSGGVSGANVEHVSEMEMKMKIDSGEIQFEEVDDEHAVGGKRMTYTTSLQRTMKDWPLPEGSTGAAIRDRTSLYCSVSWEERYAECVGPDFWQELEYLKALAPDGDLSRVRLVMGFDS